VISNNKCRFTLTEEEGEREAKAGKLPSCGDIDKNNGKRH